MQRITSASLAALVLLGLVSCAAQPTREDMCAEVAAAEEHVGSLYELTSEGLSAKDKAAVIESLTAAQEIAADLDEETIDTSLKTMITKLELPRIGFDDWSYVRLSFDLILEECRFA